MSIDELEDIIAKGENLLNVEFTKDIKNKINVYSHGLGAICHQLCLSMCTNKNIYETSEDKIVFSKTDLDLAISDYLKQKSATLKSTYDKAIKSSRKSKYGTKEILKAILKLKKEEVSSNEILNELQKEYSNYPSSTLKNYLNQLISGEREEVLRFNNDSNKYFFSNPFQKAFIELTLNKESGRESGEFLKISAKEILAFMRAKKDIEDEFQDFDSNEDYEYPE